tara:strand:+ start:1827 stop:2069 length:243 start_codon:yes stop_codon:yes gene_type:complete
LETLSLFDTIVGDFWKQNGDFWKHLFPSVSKNRHLLFKNGIDMYWRFFCFQVGDFWKHLEKCPKLGISILAFKIKKFFLW